MIKAFATFFGNAAAVSILEKMSHVHPRVIGWQIQQGHLSKKHVLDLLEHNWSIDFYNGQDAHLFKRGGSTLLPWPAAPEAGALPGSAAGPGQQETAPLARLLDVGSGGGLPGVVFAICCPQLSVGCVDTVGKKAAFVQQAAATLKLPNLRGIHARVESLAEPFDVVSCRAFAALADFTAWSRPALAPGAVWLAMKGKHPPEEIAALPASVEVFHVEPLQVPGLDAERCIVWMRPHG